METEKQPTYNDMQMVKRSFFALRNGIVADTLRKGGSPFSIIFGLNLPQIVDIGRQWGHNRDLAERLWANTSTRESMLLAPMLVDPRDFSEDDARRWVSEVKCEEVADILCHRLLRHTPYALDLAQRLALEGDDVPTCRAEDGTPPSTILKRYTGLRLMLNLAPRYPREARALGLQALESGESQLARRLAEYE